MVQASLVKDPISKLIEAKGLAEWLKWRSSCLASTRPSVQPPVLQQTNKDQSHYHKYLVELKFRKANHLVLWL
jgi:hypothetical protein